MKNRIYTRVARLAVALGALLPIACRSPQGTPANSYTGGANSAELEATRGSKSLTRDLEIVHYKSSMRDDRLQVQFDLHNKKSTKLALEWKLSWFDSEGFEVDSLDNWRPLTLGGKAFGTISGVGPTPEAIEFQLQTRRPNSVR